MGSCPIACVGPLQRYNLSDSVSYRFIDAELSDLLCLSTLLKPHSGLPSRQEVARFRTAFWVAAAATSGMMGT